MLNNDFEGGGGAGGGERWCEMGDGDGDGDVGSAEGKSSNSTGLLSWASSTTCVFEGKVGEEASLAADKSSDDGETVCF